MGLEDQIKAFSEKSSDKMDAKKLEVSNNAMNMLRELLGDDFSKIQSIALDADIGKFHSVVAPESVLAKLREANLLKT